MDAASVFDDVAEWSVHSLPGWGETAHGLIAHSMSCYPFSKENPKIAQLPGESDHLSDPWVGARQRNATDHSCSSSFRFDCSITVTWLLGTGE